MKRFTETTKWQDSWFRKLDPTLKCLWVYLCDNCDSAGVIEPDWEVVSVQLGGTVGTESLPSFGDRIKVLPNGKLWILGFIGFQYGKLSPDCKPHKSVLDLIVKHRLPVEKQRVHKGYTKGMDTLQDKDKEKEQDKEQEQERPFDAFWAVYPNKVAKEKARDCFERQDCAAIIADILAAIEKQKGSPQWLKDNGQFIPHPTTYINQRRWEGYVEVPQPSAPRLRSASDAYRE